MVRKTLIIAYALLLLALAAPPLYRLIREALPDDARPQPQAEQGSEEPAGSVTLLHDGQCMKLDMLGYLVGVVAAEMPASFPAEALKAQAVAARTYTAYCSEAKRHEQAQICSYSGCCQAWMSEDELRRRWGKDYEHYHALVRAAVEATAGEELRYEGQPVFAAFHSSSAYATEASGQIWNDTPYLVSVSSPETPENLPQLMSRVSAAPLDFRDTLLSAYPDADFSGGPESWLGELHLSESGRVDSMEIGGTRVPGTRLRQLFSLRSTAFRLDYDGQDFVFTVAGFGHGVGMSQYGAKLMAEQGADYRAILAHYYPGTELIG